MLITALLDWTRTVDHSNSIKKLLKIPRLQPLNSVIENDLRAVGDSRPVMGDVDAGYFGARITDGLLVPGDDAPLYPTSLEEWVPKTLPSRAAAKL